MARVQIFPLAAFAWVTWLQLTPIGMGVRWDSALRGKDGWQDQEVMKRCFPVSSIFCPQAGEGQGFLTLNSSSAGLAPPLGFSFIYGLSRAQ